MSRHSRPRQPTTITYDKNRARDNRGNTYPIPLWLPSGTPEDFIKHNLPAWDCSNTGGPTGPSSDDPACWVQPALGHLVGQPQKFPHLLSYSYPSG